MIIMSRNYTRNMKLIDMVSEMENCSISIPDCLLPKLMPDQGICIHLASMQRSGSYLDGNLVYVRMAIKDNHPILIVISLMIPFPNWMNVHCP